MRKRKRLAALAIAAALTCALPSVAHAQEDSLDDFAPEASVDSTTASLAEEDDADASVEAPDVQDEGSQEPAKPEEPAAPLHTSTWAEQDGVWRYFDADGKAIATAEPGFMDVAGMRFYINASGKPAFDQWVLADGAWYWMNAQGNPATGWQQVSGKWYFLDGSGKMQTGWVRPSGSTWYWLKPSGAMGEGWLLDGGSWYYLKPGSGAMATGWYLVDGEWNWSSPSGKWRPNEWVRQNGRWWYRWADGDYPTSRNGVQKIDGNYYAFDDNGWMRTGWYYDGAQGKWLYLSPASGSAMRGWVAIDGEWFYLDDRCQWVPNSWEYDGGTWWLRWATGGYASGGWEKVDGDWYLFDGRGAMLTGWQKVGGSWYYLRESGRMATGWVEVNGKWYYLNGDGSMRTGWLFDGGEWYFLDNSGAWNLEDPEMTAYAQGFSSATNWLILVDTEENQLGVFYGSYGNWTCEYLWRCSCGTAWTPTPKGTYTVTGHGYSFGSSSYTCYYYTQFWGDYLIHSVIYYKNGTVEDALGRGLSQGCVRLEIGNAKWVYDNVPTGSKVYIY